VQGCARADWALHGNGAAERLDAVFQPDEPGAPGRVGTTGPVIADAEPERTLDRLRVDVDDRSLRVLGRIGERLRDYVVGGDLDLVRQPPEPARRARR
jgi:hypothetical protein